MQPEMARPRRTIERRGSKSGAWKRIARDLFCEIKGWITYISAGRDVDSGQSKDIGRILDVDV